MRPFRRPIEVRIRRLGDQVAEIVEKGKREAEDSYDLSFWMLAGQIPGKRLMGVRVVRSDAQRLRWGNAIRRELAYPLSGLLFLGYLWILFDNRRQGWHDKLAGTIAVYSWPEGELQGTLVREQVHRLVQARQAAPRERAGA